MKVEVYLKSKSQEFMYEQPTEAWTGRWSWAPPARPIFDPRNSGQLSVKDLKYRREEFGGLIYNPKTTVVYKADKEAIDVLEDLQKGTKPEEVIGKRNLDKGSLDRFVSQILE